MKKHLTKRIFAFVLSLVMAVTAMPIISYATDESGVKPEGGTTQGQPFVAGDPSEIYRIPSMVSLEDGTIVAAADARWNGGMDGGGNDTIVSRSVDGGDSWSYQFVNYYPDNGNVFNKSSTSVCDTELVTDGINNIWMLSVFFPAGYALNSSSANNTLGSGNGTAFITVNGVDRIKLSANGNGSFDYYVGDFDSTTGRAPIMQVSDNQATTYSVDHDYYIYNNDEKQNGQNLFYSDSVYQTAKVNFLLLRKSTDKGVTWSDFTPVNMKDHDGRNENFFGVGPGRGIYVPDKTDSTKGRLCFSMYNWSGSNSSQRTSMIYSDDDGQTWDRTADFPDLPGLVGGNWSSESALVQMDDTTIRCFVRNGWCKINYADAKLQSDGTYKWEGLRDIQYTINGDPGLFGTSNTGCQLSAIKYSKKLQYNGNYYTAVLVSTPQGERSNGVVYTLLFDENNNIVNSNESDNKAISYSINSTYFGYSCLTELPDGSIADLYEINNAKNIVFTKLPNITKLSGLKIPDAPQTFEYTIQKGSSETYLADDKSEITDNGVSTVEYKLRKSVNANMGNSTAFDGQSIPLSEALYTFDFSSNHSSDDTWNISQQGVYLSIVEPQLPSSVTKQNVTIQQDGDKFRFIRNGEAMAYWRSGDKILQYDQSTAYGGAGANPDDGVAADRDREMCLFEVYRLATPYENAENNPIPGFVQVTDYNDLVNGGQYIIGCEVEGSHYFLYPSTSTNNTYSHSVKMNPTLVDAGYYVTVSPYKAGDLTLQLGHDTYNFKFLDYSNEILGVIDYDPVIFTHGSDAVSQDMNFTHVGNIVSDGSYEGERETWFRFKSNADYNGDGKIDSSDDLSKRFEILSVSVSDAESDLDFTYDADRKEYKLSGKLNLANTDEYTAFEKGAYATVKTNLKELDTGIVYTQTDRLYVTSNPVPGHIVSGMNFKYFQLSKGDRFRPMCTYIIAPGSVGNTNIKSLSYKFSGYNAKHIFEWVRNNTAYNINNFTYKNSVEQLYQSNGGATDIKGAGIIENYTLNKPTIGSGSYENKILSEQEIFNDNVRLGYYYYDASSPLNYGVDTVSNDGSNFSFSIELAKKHVDIDYSLAGIDGAFNVTIGEPYSGNRSTFDTFGSERSLLTKISGNGDITKKTYSQVFGDQGIYAATENVAVAPTADYISKNLEKKTTADCNITVNPNQTGSLVGALRYQEGYKEDDKGKIYNDLVLPFEIKYCNKSTERTAYENSIKDVLKSTEYTSTTWSAYMNKALAYQEYLNNYVVQSREQYSAAYPDNALDVISSTNKVDENGNIVNVDVPDSYAKIQKSADFTELTSQLQEKQTILDNGIEISNNVTYTPSSFSKISAAVDSGNAFYEAMGSTELSANGKIAVFEKYGVAADGTGYTSDEIRAELPGYEVGPYNTTETQAQKDINTETENLVNATPQIAADDDAYIAGKDLYNVLDKTAYTDNGTAIQTSITNNDTLIYEEYNGKNYVDIPETNQEQVDAALREVLNEMNVGENNATAQAKKYKVQIQLNGEDKHMTSADVPYVEYPYGYTLNYDFSSLVDPSTQTVKCIATSNRDGNVSLTTLNLDDYADNNYVVPILIQNDILIQITAESQNKLVVKDYYDTVIGILTGSSVTVSGENVTVGDTTITPKNSPKFSFTGWSYPDGTYNIPAEGMEIKQVGTYNEFACMFKTDGGYINNSVITDRTEFSTKILNERLNITSPNALYWTRTVVDDGGNVLIPEALASYESTFVNFASGQNVNYKAYNDASLLPDNIKKTVNSDAPAINGAGFAANGKLTLSVDYSASTNAKVLDAGIVYSTASGDDLVKGGQSGNAKTYACPRIAHWTNSNNSGTFSMSTTAKNDSYIRAYVSYTIDYSGSTIPYVAYSDTVYKCTVDGTDITVTPIN